MLLNLCDDKWRRGLIRKGRNFGVGLKGVASLAVLYCLVVTALVCSVRSVCAQPNLAGRDAPEPADDLQRLPTDRKIAQQLQELTRLARGGDVGKIRDTLQLLQAADPSVMVAAGSTTIRPLHRDLIERILGFPAELQTTLLKHPGATPQALQIAWEDGGPSALVTFLHRHSGSTESFRAHLFLAAVHRDRGHRQATLYWLLPVLHSDAPSDLQKIAIAMRDELNTGTALRSIKRQKTDSDVGLSPNTEDGSEVASTDPLNPDVPAAAVDLLHAPAWQRTLHLNSAQRHASQVLVRILAEEGDQQAIAWTAGEPSVDSQAIYVRSSGGLLAFERKTGKVLWTRLLDRQQDLYRQTEPRLRFQDGIDGPPLNASQLQNSREVLELHRDEVTAGMTADASRLFVLCDTGESAGTSRDVNQPFGMLQRSGDMVSRSFRELVAIEKATGRRLWSAGGAPLEARFGNELSQGWFAGPPTVSGGMLFGLIERDDAHWLVCLRSETGEVVWKLILAYPETNIWQDPNRQLAASRPLVADGMIWTGTNDGLLIAIDSLTQSAVWTRRMHQIPKETGMPQLRNLRNAGLQGQARPFRETWRPESMLLLSDSLLIQGVDSHQFVMIDPLTGSVQRRISPETATVILAVDDEFVVVAGPKKIQRLRLDNLKVDWDTALVASNVTPTGPGTRLDKHLLIPLSDGSIQIVRYSDGQLTDNIPALRPAFSAGGLKSIDDDVVSYGPDHVSLFSHSPTAPTLQPEAIEQARFLIETGQFADAEKVLAESTPTLEEKESVQRLLFRIATARTLNDPTHRDDHLMNAARYAATSHDCAIVQFLTLETQPEITVDVVVEFLKAAPAVLNAELPDRALLKKQILSPVADDPIGHRILSAEPNFTTTRPMRDVLLQVFEQHLADPDVSKSTAWLSALKQLSNEDLLSITSDTAALALQDELLGRAEEAIQAGRLTESTWHLLLEARHCENQIRSAQSGSAALQQESGVFNARFTSLVDRFRNQVAVEAARADLPLRPHPAALSLLDVVRAEMLPTVTAEKLPTPHNALAQQWSAWKDQTYSVVPVNPVSAATVPQPNETMLTPRYREDRFLSAWRWSTFREPSLLAVRSLMRPDEPLCTIDGGMFDALSIGGNGSVMRFGSVVLVQNSMGLSAISLIDQRVLWNRRIPNQRSSGMWQFMAEMHLFKVFLNSSIAWQQVFGRDLRICGGNDRWICVQSPSRVEMIDLLTGQNLWSLHTEPGSLYVFATESCVFLSHLPSGSPGDNRKTVTCLNRIDGTNRESAISFSRLWQTILATGDELVICEPSQIGAGTAALEWVNSVTGEARHSLALTDMVNCQFMDARTLVSVTGKGTFEIIDLLTAEKQVMHFSVDANHDAEEEKGTTPGHLTKAMVMADATNYYVLPFPDQQAVQMMLGSAGDLQLYPIKKELRAIDRATGKLRWVWDAEESTAAWFEPTADPILLLVSFSARVNKANALRPLAIPGLVFPNDRRMTITGLSRISGTKLFDYAVSSRFPVPDLKFKITPQQHLDLQAFGNRVRFVPEPTTTVVP